MQDIPYTFSTLDSPSLKSVPKNQLVSRQNGVGHAICYIDGNLPPKTYYIMYGPVEGSLAKPVNL
jgi:hypothetical protein